MKRLLVPVFALIGVTLTVTTELHAALLTPAEPLITAIEDVGNDQGRMVKITFNRSGMDSIVTNRVTSYEIYRRNDAPPVNAARLPRATGWTMVGTAPAHTEAVYHLDVPTLADSPFHSVFFVRAATDDPHTFYDSAPDSGYSIDNLAPAVPDGLALINFPNPFNPTTTVTYTVPSRGSVTVAVYNTRGARLKVLVNDEERDAGAYRVEWNGRDERGNPMSSGIYFARIEHQGTTQTRKLVLMK